MLYGKVLRSPYAHARIKSIDTRHAMELPGVHAVITSEDLAQPSGRIVDLAEGVMHNMRFLSNNIMAADKVLYKGHAIAIHRATAPSGVTRWSASSPASKTSPTNRPTPRSPKRSWSAKNPSWSSARWPAARL